MLAAMQIDELREIGGRQLGLVTSRDARRLLTAAQVKTAIRQGWLAWVHPGVLVFTGSRRSWHQALFAAVLSAGRSAVASHASAAALWGVPGFAPAEPTPIEVTVRRGRDPRRDDVIVHTTRVLPRSHVGQRDVIAVTSIERTLCDLGAELGPARLGRVVDELITRRAVSLPTLRAVHAELHRGGRPTAVMADVLGLRGEHWDHAQSPKEPVIAEWLVEAGLPPPVPQYEIGGYRVDWAYPEERVFLEYDGFEPHSTRTAFDGDRRRGNALALAAGATVLRFTSASTREEVVRDVTRALERTAVRAS
jgi:hypothetical protein